MPRNYPAKIGQACDIIAKAHMNDAISLESCQESHQKQIDVRILSLSLRLSVLSSLAKQVSGWFCLHFRSTLKPLPQAPDGCAMEMLACKTSEDLRAQDGCVLGKVGVTSACSVFCGKEEGVFLKKVSFEF